MKDIFDGSIHRDVITQLISLLERDERDYWFQQDGVTYHTSNETMALKEIFGGRLISDDVWPQRSPDLTSSNLYL